MSEGDHDPPMPKDLGKEFEAELIRHFGEVRKMMFRNPELRRSFALGALAGAIAIVDWVGEDVEGFVTHLRAAQPKLSPGFRVPS